MNRRKHRRLLRERVKETFGNGARSGITKNGNGYMEVENMFFAYVNLISGDGIEIIMNLN